jgi:hypothetical protein
VTEVTARRPAAGDDPLHAARLGGAVVRGWLAPGVELTLIGDANDYTGKGLSGGRARGAAARRRRRSSPRRT